MCQHILNMLVKPLFFPPVKHCLTARVVEQSVSLQRCQCFDRLFVTQHFLPSSEQGTLAPYDLTSSSQAQWCVVVKSKQHQFPCSSHLPSLWLLIFFYILCWDLFFGNWIRGWVLMFRAVLAGLVLHILIWLSRKHSTRIWMKKAKNKANQNRCVNVSSIYLFHAYLFEKHVWHKPEPHTTAFTTWANLQCPSLPGALRRRRLSICTNHK